jgi:hypothetical protein
MWIPLLGLLDRASVTGEVTYAGYVSKAHLSRTPISPPPEGGTRFFSLKCAKHFSRSVEWLVNDGLERL